MMIENLYQLFTQYPDITTDSRNIRPGSIYVGLKGEHFDGNAFAAQALTRGAEYAVIDNSKYCIDKRTILVENTYETLSRLANFHRHKLHIPIIAITGTNGKTTTKELIREVLSQQYKVHATTGNLNNHIGVPLTLLAMSPNIEIGVVEMGANHPKEINHLCHVADPDFGLITNIGKAHLEGFGGFEGVINTKKELYDFLISKESTIFYNSDNKLLTSLLRKDYAKLVPYGISTGSRFIGKINSIDPHLEVTIELTHDIKDHFTVKTNLVGEYNIENVLAAVCVGLYFNIPIKKIKSAIEAYVPTNNRSQLNNTGKNRLLLDHYNANPSSTEAAIRNFLKLEGSNKVIVLGDMLELGNESEAEHAAILKLLSGLKDIKVILVGPNYMKLAALHGFTAFLSSDDLGAWLIEHPIDQSFVMIKGSRGIHLEKIVDLL
jgi:UDP-N-acetylmuramoyl-tripeptide--D-alanyl-D-alanine ligase